MNDMTTYITTNGHQSTHRVHDPSQEDIENNTAHVMKSFPRSHGGSPREVRVKAWKVDGSGGTFFSKTHAVS